MKGLFKKYFFLPLFILLGGLHHVSSHMVSKDILKSSIEHFFSSEHSEKQRFYSRDFHHNKSENAGAEIVEQTSNSFQKDLVDDVPFRVFDLKNYTHSFFNLLSRRLSLNKPFLVSHLGDAIYLVIRVFRL